MEEFIPIEGNRFIDLNKDFDKVSLAFVAKDKENDPDKLIVAWYNYPDEPTKIDYSDYSGKAFPDLNSPFTKLSDYYKDLRGKTNSSRREFIKFLYNSKSKKLEISEAIKLLVDIAKIDTEQAEAILKLGVAKGDFKFSKLKSGDFLVLASIFTEIEDKKRFLSSIIDELSSKSERVGLIIKHHQTTGNYREQLLISVLKKYVPKKYHVATGFIDGRTKQIDIIIYDQQNYIPLFRENDLVVVKPDSVRAVIEVKTTLNSDSLWEALEGIHQVFRHSTHAIPVFKGVFAFNSNYESTESVIERIKNFYNDSSNQYYSSQLNDIVDSVCVPEKHIVFTDYVKPKSKFFKNTISPGCYSFTNQGDISVEASSFFSDLFAHLDVDLVAKKVNLNHFEILGHEIEYSWNGFIHEDWTPQSSFRNEHDFTQDGILKRLTDIDEWIKGKITGSDLYEKYFGDLDE